VAEAAHLLASARNPIVITKALGRDPEAVPALVALAEALALPIFEQAPTHLNFPQHHPLHVSFDPGPWLSEADLVLVVECDAPWYPHLEAPRPDAKVIQVGVDPLYSRYPIRGFHGDAALAGSPRLALKVLAETATPLVDRGVIAERRQRWESEHASQREARAARARAVAADAPIDMAWLSRCVGNLVDERTILVNEYDFDANQGMFRRPGSYFSAPPAGGLGWGLGAALGAKLAAPDQTVICCVGDGAYIFGAPTAAHFVSRAYDIPVLFVVFNNRMWNAVKRAVETHAKDGWAMKMDSMPLTELDPAPDYELICRASGGHAERVEDPTELPAALERALHAVKVEKRQALLNVICKKP
jgi:acetolactate synthase-1/2/3 large subunit